MWAVVKRDFVLGFRQGGGVFLTLAFFLVLTILAPFGVGPAQTTLAKIAPGILWTGALLSTLLSLDRILQLDYEDGTLDALATSPLPLANLAFAKSIAHWMTTGLPLTLASIPLGFLLLALQGIAEIVRAWVRLQRAGEDAA